MISRNDDPSSQPTVIVGVAFTALVVVVVLALQAYFSRVQEEELDAKLGGVASEAVVRVLEEQQARIEEYRWIDRDQGTVAIPIDRAMDLVVADLAHNAPAEPSNR